MMEYVTGKMEDYSGASNQRQPGSHYRSHVIAKTSPGLQPCLIERRGAWNPILMAGVSTPAIAGAQRHPENAIHRRDLVAHREHRFKGQARAGEAGGFGKVRLCHRGFWLV
jgi:hypothetical protein